MDTNAFLQALILDSEKRQAVLEKEKILSQTLPDNL
jgi:hypothetical protein